MWGRRRECDVLDRILDAVRGGAGRALVVRGEPGVGKTALLDYLAEQASGCRVARVAGVESEMELAYAGLHQLLTPMLDRLERLPGPQREALRTAFGLSSGAAPDRFLVGLATLSLLAEVAEEHPLLCLVDDEQWLDSASAQVMAFVARRLVAESVGLVFAARVPSDELAGLPELVVEGLREADARALLAAALSGPLDARVRDRIVAEARGNPLALLELPGGVTPAELAGGFALPDAVPLSGRIEESFRRRLDALPADTRMLLLVAAAHPVGDPVLVWRAAERLGIGTQAATQRPRPACWRSAPGSGSAIPWCARRPIGRRRCPSGSRRTGPWPRPPTRSSIPTAAPGTGRTPRRGPTRASPPSWSTRPAAPRRAGAWPRRPRSWSVRRS